MTEMLKTESADVLALDHYLRSLLALYEAEQGLKNGGLACSRSPHYPYFHSALDLKRNLLEDRL